MGVPISPNAPTSSASISPSTQTTEIQSTAEKMMGDASNYMTMVDQKLAALRGTPSDPMYQKAVSDIEPRLRSEYQSAEQRWRGAEMQATSRYLTAEARLAEDTDPLLKISREFQRSLWGNVLGAGYGSTPFGSGGIVEAPPTAGGGLVVPARGQYSAIQFTPSGKRVEAPISTSPLLESTISGMKSLITSRPIMFRTSGTPEQMASTVGAAQNIQKQRASQFLSKSVGALAGFEAAKERDVALEDIARKETTRLNEFLAPFYKQRAEESDRAEREYYTAIGEQRDEAMLQNLRLINESGITPEKLSVATKGQVSMTDLLTGNLSSGWMPVVSSLLATSPTFSVSGAGTDWQSLSSVPSTKTAIASTGSERLLAALNEQATGKAPPSIKSILTSAELSAPVSGGRNIYTERPQYVGQYSKEQLAAAVPKAGGGWDIRPSDAMRQSEVLAALAQTPAGKLRTDAIRAGQERYSAMEAVQSGIAQRGYSSDQERINYLRAEAKDLASMGALGGTKHRFFTEPTKQMKEYGISSIGIVPASLATGTRAPRDTRAEDRASFEAALASRVASSPALQARTRANIAADIRIAAMEEHQARVGDFEKYRYEHRNDVRTAPDPMAVALSQKVDVARKHYLAAEALSNRVNAETYGGGKFLLPMTKQAQEAGVSANNAMDILTGAGSPRISSLLTKYTQVGKGAPVETAISKISTIPTGETPSILGGGKYVPLADRLGIGAGASAWTPGTGALEQPLPTITANTAADKDAVDSVMGSLNSIYAQNRPLTAQERTTFFGFVDKVGIDTASKTNLKNYVSQSDALYTSKGRVDAIFAKGKLTNADIADAKTGIAEMARYDSTLASKYEYALAHPTTTTTTTTTTTIGEGKVLIPFTNIEVPLVGGMMKAWDKSVNAPLRTFSMKLPGTEESEVGASQALAAKYGFQIGAGSALPGGFTSVGKKGGLADIGGEFARGEYEGVRREPGTAIASYAITIATMGAGGVPGMAMKVPRVASLVSKVPQAGRLASIGSAMWKYGLPAAYGTYTGYRIGTAENPAFEAGRITTTEGIPILAALKTPGAVSSVYSAAKGPAGKVVGKAWRMVNPPTPPKTFPAGGSEITIDVPGSQIRGVEVGGVNIHEASNVGRISEITSPGGRTSVRVFDVTGLEPTSAEFTEPGAARPLTTDIYGKPTKAEIFPKGGTKSSLEIYTPPESPKVSDIIAKGGRTPIERALDMGGVEHTGVSGKGPKSRVQEFITTMKKFTTPAEEGGMTPYVVRGGKPPGTPPGGAPGGAQLKPTGTGTRAIPRPSRPASLTGLKFSPMNIGAAGATGVIQKGYPFITSARSYPFSYQTDRERVYSFEKPKEDREQVKGTIQFPGLKQIIDTTTGIITTQERLTGQRTEQRQDIITTPILGEIVSQRTDQTTQQITGQTFQTPPYTPTLPNIQVPPPPPPPTRLLFPGMGPGGGGDRGRGFDLLGRRRILHPIPTPYMLAPALFSGKQRLKGGRIQAKINMPSIGKGKKFNFNFNLGGAFNKKKFKF